MKIFDFEQIKNRNIAPSDCLKWVECALREKYDCILPGKVSITTSPDVFFNTMPVYLHPDKRFGVKIVSRFPDRRPSLQSDILLYDSLTGELLAFMDGSWITAMRTGAVAALSISYLQKKAAKNYAFIGLGNTARATLLCLLELVKGPMQISLLAYKDQTDSFIERFEGYQNISFTVYSDVHQMIADSDVIISSVTVAHDLFAPDECFKPGVLVVPIHTRGFQNCDLFFDKVFADDVKHVCSFKYFNQFKKFDEFARVLLGENPGRESEQERILVYNIGIALHDIFFASKIYDKLSAEGKVLDLNMTTEKFWV